MRLTGDPRGILTAERVYLKKEAEMGIVWTVLAIIGLIVVLQYVF
jgi:hypothetical protein